MTLSVKDASGATQTIKTNDDMAGSAGAPNANVLSVQGISGGTPQPVSGAVSVANLPATQAVSAAALPLPAGAATDASLGTLGATPPALPGASTGIMGLLRWIGSLFASLIATGTGNAYRVVLVDPASGNGSLVQAFHNADNQTVGSTSYGLLTGGVDQLINASGNLDRKRAVSGDAMAGTGLAAEVPMLWNGASYDRMKAVGADGVAATGIVQEAVALFNGATYDRAVNGAGVGAKALRVVMASDQAATPAYRPGIPYTERSGTITAGGTAQTLAAANTARKGYRVQNLSTADLWINDKGAAATASQPSFKLPSQASYESPAFGASTAAISIFGATTGQAFEAMEG